MTILGVPPTQLALEISPELQQQAWQQGQSFPRVHDQWTIYLNQVCLATLLPWLETEQMDEVAVWPDAAALLPIWTVVNGTTIVLGSKRLLLVPSRNLDTSELCVPQEWVDSPTWAADYYLAVRVNPDELWLHVWGYTTHDQLKHQAQYDPADRTYHLDAQALISDLSVLWVVHQLCPDEPTQAALMPLPSLSQAQTTDLLQQLANPAIEQPRLEVPFQVWGALLAQPDWRQHLYETRSGALSMEVMEVLQASETLVLPPVNLRQWFEGVFEESWQSLETLFDADLSLAFNFRRYGEVADPGLKRGRGIRLPRTFSDEPIALIVNLELEPDNRVKVQSQLYALGASRTLPPGLRLEVVSDTGRVLETVVAREQDNCIQLPRFKCPPGRLFRLRTSLKYLVYSTAFIS